MHRVVWHGLKRIFSIKILRYLEENILGIRRVASQFTPCFIHWVAGGVLSLSLSPPLLALSLSFTESSEVAELSVSSDGRYALSSHTGKHLILWDIKKRKSQILNEHTSQYSASFIQNTHYFLWQDANTLEVHVQSVEGNILKTLKLDFPVYGHVMTADLKYYMASEGDRNLHWFSEGRGWHAVKRKEEATKHSVEYSWLSVQGEHVLIAASYNSGRYAHSFEASKQHPDFLLRGVILWSIKTGRPEQRFISDSYKTVADLSSDARYVVAGGDNLRFYMWDALHGTRREVEHPPNPSTECSRDDSVCRRALAKHPRFQPMPPEDFVKKSFQNFSDTSSVRFIDEAGHFLRIIELSRYGVLYHVNSPKPLAYINLAKSPSLYATYASGSQNVIVSAPKARILVAAQGRYNRNPFAGTSEHNGILVYRFHPKTWRMELLWAPEGPPNYEVVREVEP